MRPSLAMLVLITLSACAPAKYRASELGAHAQPVMANPEAAVPQTVPAPPAAAQAVSLPASPTPPVAEAAELSSKDFDLEDEEPHPIWAKFDALPDSSARLALARACIGDPDETTRLACLWHLYDLGREEEAAIAFTDLLLRGDQLEGMTWEWIHRRQGFQRRIAAVRLELESRFATLDAAQRERAMEVLCPESRHCSQPRRKGAR